MLLVIWEKGELGLGRFNRYRTPDGREVRELVIQKDSEQCSLHWTISLSVLMI